MRVITGVNLPALITALSHHEECAARIAVIAEGAARGGISTSCGKLPPSRTLSMQTKQLTVLNKLGLHARPCALLAKTAGFFKSSITLTHNNHSVDAKSILGS